jgi:hypothetical protein
MAKKKIAILIETRKINKAKSIDDESDESDNESNIL